jgi:hypothetical protein
MSWKSWFKKVKKEPEVETKDKETQKLDEKESYNMTTFLKDKYSVATVISKNQIPNYPYYLKHEKFTIWTAKNPKQAYVLFSDDSIDVERGERIVERAFEIIRDHKSHFIF